MNDPTTSAEAKQRYNKKLAYGFLVFAIVFVAAVLLIINVGDDESTSPSAETVADDQGLSEAKRQEIYQAIVAAERRAMQDADELIPIDANDPEVSEKVEPNAEKYQELMAQYKTEVRDRYGITEDQMFAIGAEGVTNQWSSE